MSKTNYLKDWQAARGLVADGIIGKATLKAFADEYHLATIEAVHILAQCQVESRNFTTGVENLNYSATQLGIVFKKYFKPDEVLRFAHFPVMIANRVYGGRMGNTDQGDGWKYRGHGPIQLTGKKNYRAYFKWCGLPLDSDPAILLEPKHYFRSAVWFFTANGLLSACGDDASDCVRVSRAVNVGSLATKTRANAEDERVAAFRALKRLT